MALSHAKYDENSCDYFSGNQDATEEKESRNSDYSEILSHYHISGHANRKADEEYYSRCSSRYPFIKSPDCIFPPPSSTYALTHYTNTLHKRIKPSFIKSYKKLYRPIYHILSGAKRVHISPERAASVESQIIGSTPCNFAQIDGIDYDIRGSNGKR